MYEVYVKTQFSAAHQLKGYDGKFENLHGHNWSACVTVEAEDTDEIGVGIDFVELKEKVDGFLEKLDYKNINEIPPFDKENPSAENIARWLYKQLAASLDKQHARVKKVEVYEMPDCGAAYYE